MTTATDSWPLESDPPWVKRAFAELDAGVREVAGVRDNPRILEYWKVIPEGRQPKGELHDEISWCSVGACYCMEAAGFRSPRRAMARSWLSWGRALEKPERGCVAVFWRIDRDGQQGHVAFYLFETEHMIYVLGGNQGNRWSVSAYPRSQLLGYRLPAIGDRLPQPTGDAP